MKPTTISTRADPDLLNRINKLAEADRRSPANIIHICVVEYLPQLEAELAAKLRVRKG